MSTRRRPLRYDLFRLDPPQNFGLGPFPELGITGVAIGTTVGRTVGVVYQLVALGSGRGRLRVRQRHLRLDSDLALRLLRVSAGTAWGPTRSFPAPARSSTSAARTPRPSRWTSRAS